MFGMIDELITITRNQLDRYTSDEIGLNERKKYEKMNNKDILSLLEQTLQYELGLNRDLKDIEDMFENDLIYMFNVSAY